MTLFSVICCTAQGENEFYNIKGTVFDGQSEVILPYANVYNQQRFTGTATNQEGYFELPNNQIGDTIIISYLGFNDKILIVTSNPINEIRLTPSADFLEEIVVTAQSDYLFDMISKLRKQKRTKSKNAKTYFYLETLLFNEPIEIIESYYNGKYSDYGLNKLHIKKGRIGLRPVNNRYFSSTESSRIFSLHNLFSKSKLFPNNPLSIRKKELKKKYVLDLDHTYLDDKEKIYVINFSPKKKDMDLFGGTIWINREENKILKVKLKIKNSEIHPFVPIGNNTIQYVDMEMTKSFQEIGNSSYINSIDYNYNVIYQDTSGHEMEAITKAYLKAYDYNDKFDLPKFEFTRHLHEDYRNITATGYDSVFWNGTTEFRFYDRMYEVENFIKENYIKDNTIFPKRNSNQQQLQFPYILWNKNRFEMTQASGSKIERMKQAKAFERDRWNLNVKLYCDVNYIQDSMVYRLASILDPVDSYYYFYLTDIDRIFMNMYFDLMEIQKQKFESDLSQMQLPSKEMVNNLYEKHLNEFKLNSKLFVSETKRGKNWAKVKKWNKYIFEKLNVDNIKHFDLTSSNKK